jgi:hypothetical protein
MTSGRRTLLTAVAVAVLSTVAVAAPAGAHKESAAGVMYGGVTPQGWPVVIEVTPNHRQVVRSRMGFDLTCQAGGFTSSADGYVHLAIHKNRRFAFSYSNSRVNNDDGTFTLWSGSIRGRMNKAGTKISGSGRLEFTDHAANGPTTDTCDSGVVKFSVKQ